MRKPSTAGCWPFPKGGVCYTKCNFHPRGIQTNTASTLRVWPTTAPDSTGNSNHRFIFQCQPVNFHGKKRMQRTLRETAVGSAVCLVLRLNKNDKDRIAFFAQSNSAHLLFPYCLFVSFSCHFRHSSIDTASVCYLNGISGISKTVAETVTTILVWHFEH